MQNAIRPLLICLLGMHWLAWTIGAADLDGRPSILDQSGSVMDSHGEVYQLYQNNESTVEYLHHMVRKLVSRLETHEIFLLSRDSDPLYDALVAALGQTQSGRTIVKRVHRVLFSRYIAALDGPTLLSWLKFSGLDFEKLLTGDQKAIVIDIGWEGSQPTLIVQAMKDEIRNRDNFGTNLSRLVDNLDVFLMGGTGKIGYEDFREALRNDDSGVGDGNPERLFDYYSNLTRGREAFGFHSILEEEIGRTACYNGAKKLQDVSYNWAPSPSKVASDGRSLIFSNASDSSVSRSHVLLWQQVIWSHFASPNVRRELDPLIEAVIDKRKPRFKINYTQPDPNGIPAQVRDLVVRELNYEKDLLAIVAKDRTRPGYFRIVSSRRGEAESRKEIRTQIRRLKRVSELGLPALQYVESTDQSATFALPTTTNGEGMTGEEWLGKWEFDRFPKDSPEFLGLIAFVTKMIDAGVYCGQLTPKNLWVADGQWYIMATAGVSKTEPINVAAAMNYNLFRRWHPEIARALHSFHLTKSFPILEQRSPTDEPKLGERYLLRDGTPILIDEILNQKEHATIFAIRGPFPGAAVLKWMRKPGLEKYLTDQFKQRQQLQRAGIPAALPIYQYGHFAIYRRIQGQNGKAWLSSTSRDEEAEKLGELISDLSKKGVFVSGLWPSHVVYGEDGWEIVGHHGVVTGRKEEELKEDYRKRFDERWLPRAPADCAARIRAKVLGG